MVIFAPLNAYKTNEVLIFRDRWRYPILKVVNLKKAIDIWKELK